QDPYQRPVGSLLEACPRRHDLPGRGGGPLVGPLRGQTGPLPPGTVGAQPRGRRRHRPRSGGYAMGAPILELHDVHRTHGSGETAVHALRGVSIAVRSGELVGVMGPSGSGKSTLLNLAGGLDVPTSGDVRVAGESLSGMSKRALAALRRRTVGYVFQDLNLLPSLSAVENVALPLELDGRSVRAARQVAQRALAEVGMGELAGRFPDELSGGQQQRVAIARALVGQRRLVLADESTGALDTQTGEAVLKLLRDRVDAGAAGVLVTHEARHAAWADRVIFLRDGRIVDTSGPLAEPEDLLQPEPSR